MAQWLREHTTLGENLNSIRSISVEQLTTVDPAPGNSMPSLGFHSPTPSLGFHSPVLMGTNTDRDIYLYVCSKQRQKIFQKQKSINCAVINVVGHAIFICEMEMV